jgi:hypothetical protein
MSAPKKIFLELKEIKATYDIKQCLQQPYFRSHAVEQAVRHWLLTAAATVWLPRQSIRDLQWRKCTVIIFFFESFGFPPISFNRWSRFIHVSSGG